MTAYEKLIETLPLADVLRYAAARLELDHMASELEVEAESSRPTEPSELFGEAA
jgi:hypothetical protein